MRRILIAFLVAGTAGLFMWAATTAAADVNDPGSGCNDQVNGASCVPDPSDEGQDCEAHGNNADGNENHCLPTPTETTTTTAVTTTVVPTTAPPTTETTATTTTTEVTPPPSETQTTPPSSPTKQASTPDGKQPKPTKLAFTGVEDVVPIAGVALTLLTLGAGLMWRGRRDAS